MVGTEISLKMPADLGSIVVATTDVQNALRRNQHVKVRPEAVEQDTIGSFRDFGATAIAILGTGRKMGSSLRLTLARN